MRPSRSIFLAAGALVAIAACAAEPIPRSSAPTPVRFVGDLQRADDLSAVALWQGRLVLASDEGAALQLLDPTDDRLVWRAQATPIALRPDDREVDIEALAVDGERLYALGSHSFKRRRIDGERTRTANLERWSRIETEPARQALYRLTPGANGDVAHPRIESIGLRPAIAAHPILAPFAAIPSKENGVDLEGLALLSGRLVAGFRSPVLRQGYVPLIEFDFDAPERPTWRFLDLDGRGVRGLEGVDGGLLVLAAFENEPTRPGIWFWDGTDGFPGTDAPAPRLERLLDLADAPGAPEGLLLLDEDDDGYRVVLVRDGIAGGRPEVVFVPRRSPDAPS